MVAAVIPRFCDAVVCCDAVVELGREVDAALWLIVALYSHVQSTALQIRVRCFPSCFTADLQRCYLGAVPSRMRAARVGRLPA